MSEKIIGPDRGVVDLEKMTVTEFTDDGKIVERNIYEVFTFEEWQEWEEKFQKDQC